MPRPPRISDEAITEDLKAGLTQSQILHKHDMIIGGSVCDRLRRLAKRAGVEIARTPHARRTADEIKDERGVNEYIKSHGRRHLSVKNGVILIGSDAHYWPGIVSTAHRAFVKFCSDMGPVAVVMNGDSLDGATISRFPRIGWDTRPTLVQELNAVKERKEEIEKASRTKSLYWPLGNHDFRYETRLAANSPEFQGVDGFSLKDHFPMWTPCWSLWVNDDVVIKHRYKGGIHSTHNNTLWAGMTTVTGHDHSPKVTPFSDYRGTRFGVNTGTLAQPYGPQFEDYTEDNPVNWRSSFAVLTFWNGTLLWPELVHVIDEEAGLVQFRGQVIEV